MQMFKSPRTWLAVGMTAVCALGSIIAAERSSASMSTAATTFVASLTPEQRAKATFAFNSDERTHWHFNVNCSRP